MARALEGIRVVDLSHVLAAPTTTMYLADLGAEVIHVEPPQGDDSREYGPFAGSPDKNRSGYFISLNRNKKGMVLDLKQEEGKEILRQLIAVSDIVVENYRPTTMRKLGFGWDELRKINPRIIYCSISGFGQDTLPGYAERPSYDMVAQAYSGIMSITGPEEGPPCRVGSSVGDIIAGMQAVVGILAAVVYREKTGRGQHLDMSMIDGLFATLENAVARYTINGEIPGPLGGIHPSITPFQGYRTADSWIIAAAGTEGQGLGLVRHLVFFLESLGGLGQAAAVFDHLAHAIDRLQQVPRPGTPGRCRGQRQPPGLFEHALDRGRERQLPRGAPQRAQPTHRRQHGTGARARRPTMRARPPPGSSRPAPADPAATA